MDKSRWDGLLARLDIADQDSTYQALINAYAEKHRAYHTGKHINDCLLQLDRHIELLNEPDKVEIAIWFHDAIYKPFSKSNEEDSADWAAQFLIDNGVAANWAADVHRLIIATQHDVPLSSNDDQLLVDIDLSILGASPECYAQFEKDVRFEYRLVPTILFKQKRGALLKSFLARDSIYHHASFQGQFEQNARRNLEDAVQTLLG